MLDNIPDSLLRPLVDNKVIAVVLIAIATPPVVIVATVAAVIAVALAAVIAVALPLAG